MRNARSVNIFISVMVARQRNRDLNELTGKYQNYFCESCKMFFAPLSATDEGNRTYTGKEIEKVKRN